jgi:hypothetical protein
VVRPPILRQPVRAAGLTYLVLAVLVAICAPLMPDVDPSRFFLAGSAYSLLLALFAVGMMLAGQRLLHWWALAGSGVAVASAGYVVWLVAVSRVSSDAFFHLLPWVLRGLLAALAIHLVAGVVIAGSGWVRFYRDRRIAAEPGGASDTGRRIG